MLELAERKRLADQLRGREVRRVPVAGLELREDNGILTMTGWASVTERSYDMGWYQETIKRGAFGKTLNEKPDVQLLLNHEGLPLARTISGTLRLAEDERGLRSEADLNPDDPDVQRLLPKVERGDIDQMSFGFRVTRQQWDDDRENRDIAEVSLDRGDVSIVNYGANPHTSFSLRDAQQFIEKMDPQERDAFLRSLAPTEIEEIVEVEPAAEAERANDLDLYIARARALRLRSSAA